MKHFDGFGGQIACWTFGQWKDWLRKGTDPIRLEYCLEKNTRMTYLRSIPGHCGRGFASIQNRKTMGKFLTDGQVTSVMLFPHLITGPSPKEDSSPEEWRLSQEGKTCFFTVVNLVSNSILTPRIE